MGCTDMNNTTSMDETIMVKGCLGRLPCTRPGRSSKSAGKKAAVPAEKDTKALNSAPAPASPKASKPSAAILPSPRQNLPQHLHQGPELKSSTSSDPKPYRQDAIKGQLQLGFYVDGPSILVQIFEAKNLKFRSPFTVGDSCYVSVELVSKSEENKRQTTKAVFDQSPIFNEEFILRMKNGSNESARLVISVYKTSTNGCDEMIGCMSFGISGLQEKCTSNTDTYYLLNRTLGIKKHLRTSQGKHLNLLANMSGVSSLSSLMNRQTTSLLLRATSGIQTHKQPQRRFRNVSQFTVPSGSILDYETDSGYSLLPTDSMWSYQMAVYNQQHLNSTTKLSTPRHNVTTTRSHLRDLQRITSDLDSCSLSSISLCDLTSSPGQASFNKFRIIYGNDRDGEPQEYAGSDSSGSSLKLSDFHYDSSEVDKNRSLKHMEDKTSDYFESSSGTNSTSSLKLSDFIDTSSSTDNSAAPSCIQHSSTPGITEEDALCLQLVHAEDEFVTLMHQGVLRFSRPLRHGILTAHEHQALFQNVEKLLAISEFHLKKLANCWAKSQYNLQAIGNIYEAQIQVLCDAYVTYFGGLTAADQVLADLVRKPGFADFLSQELPGVPNIQLDTFLQTPQKHLQNLISIFEDLAAVTKSQQQPSHVLLKVQRELSMCWEQCLETNEKLYPHVNTGSAEKSPENHFESYISTEFKKAEQVENCSINPDLALLEERLQFSSKVQPFSLAVPGRHIVFSGEVDFIINWKWVKVTVYLTNDVIIVTQKEADGHVTVISEPINLKDILTTQFECLHPCEILLTAKSGSRDTAWSHMRTATFRTCTVGEKETLARLVRKCINIINNERRTSL